MKAVAEQIDDILRTARQRACPECGGRGVVADPAQIGARMRKERELAGITGRALARKMGYSAMYICDLEHGRRTWKNILLEQYLKAISSICTPNK